MDGSKEIKRDENDEIEINLMQLFREFRRHWLSLLLACLVGGILVGAYSKYCITPQYESTAVMYILTKETTLTSLADLQIGSQLANDYKVVVTTRTVLENTIRELGLEGVYSANSLKNEKLTIENPTNTRILNITARDPNPELAKKIADTVAKNAADYIADTMEITPPKIIETGEIPTTKASPRNSRNAIIGAIVCGLAVAFIIALRSVLNDAVTTVDDVEKYLGLTVLASLPDRSNKNDKKGNKTKAGKRSKKWIYRFMSRK